MEIFKDIIKYENIYQISTIGNIKSLKLGKERILKPTLNTSGYLFVKLYNNGAHLIYQKALKLTINKLV